MEEIDILVVEDSPEIVDIIETFYSILPYSYKVTNSAEEALEIIKDIKFKVHILDINLGTGKMHGVDLAIAIRSNNKTAKIYAFTGHMDLFDDIAPEVAGFDGAFYKSEGYKNLLDQVTTDLEAVYKKII